MYFMISLYYNINPHKMECFTLTISITQQEVGKWYKYYNLLHSKESDRQYDTIVSYMSEYKSLWKFYSFQT